MDKREEEHFTAAIIAIIGLILCGYAVGYFFGVGFGFLLVGLPLLTLGIYGLIKN
jgi:hypothetical protein